MLMVLILDADNPQKFVLVAGVFFPHDPAFASGRVQSGVLGLRALACVYSWCSDCHDHYLHMAHYQPEDVYMPTLHDFSLCNNPLTCPHRRYGQVFGFWWRDGHLGVNYKRGGSNIFGCSLKKLRELGFHEEMPPEGLSVYGKDYLKWLLLTSQC